MELTVTDIQHFSTGDGPGIRTTVFLSGCNLRCPWCHNPEALYTDIFNPRTRKMNVLQIANELINDKDFYIESGGGVTISGGECMLCASQLVPLLKILKDEGIHIIIDTAGNVEYLAYEIINHYVDEYYYDIKTADEKLFSDVANGNLELVIANYKKLIKDGKKVRVRVPLIYGFNTSEEDTDKLFDLFQKLGIKEIDFLPFHRLGSGKYNLMGLDYKYKDYPSMTVAEAERLTEKFKAAFEIKIEI